MELGMLKNDFLKPISLLNRWPNDQFVRRCLAYNSRLDKKLLPEEPDISPVSKIVLQPLGYIFKQTGLKVGGQKVQYFLVVEFNSKRVQPKGKNMHYDFLPYKEQHPIDANGVLEKFGVANNQVNLISLMLQVGSIGTWFSGRKARKTYPAKFKSSYNWGALSQRHAKINVISNFEVNRYFATLANP